ncbi:hypothetical protein LSH36_2259g00017 [Paralvinella palmiformis]|uniref:C-type lectin domain-containing protein n=1 Tax=Paralvinella palmiformis TaxID=53620 RepID=A0AAD9IQU5_9ANNE|nr:hypothetical protein LSH36_2259g00017 [Paralvinella palmiformis]
MTQNMRGPMEPTLVINGLKSSQYCDEEFVQLVPLKGKTTGADVLQAVQVVMDTIGLKPERLCGMTMDGAPSMVGRKNRVISLMENIRQDAGCCVLSSNCQHIIKTICEGSSCYYLYEIDSIYLTWSQSLEVCNNEGLKMARIESSQTQNVIERLLQDLPRYALRQIWIGGRRSTDDKWRYINGSEFNKQITTSSQTASYCLYVRLCKDRAPEYHDENCDEITTSSRLLCQYDESKTDSCSSSDSHFGDKCYRKTKYNGQEPNKIDWYNGETYCRQSDIQGDIAYSYLDDDTLINNIINLVNDNKVCVQLWLGVRNRIWFWMTGSNINGDKQPINYFNWDNNIEIDSSDDDCSQTTNTATPITTTTTTTNSMFTKDISTDPVNKSTTTTTTDTTIDDSNNKCTLNTVIIILIIITVISVTGVIILVVYCIHLRRRIQSLTYEVKRSNSRNIDVTTGIGILETPGLSTSDDVTQISTQIQQDIQDIQYEVIDGGREKRQNTEMSSDFVNIQRDTESDPYEKPSTYINMVDRPNVYQSLNNN